MSVNAVAFALDCRIGDPLAKVILLSIADRADSETGYAWPSMESIAENAECSTRTVLRKLRRLVSAGVLRVVSGKADGLSNYYQVLMPGVGQDGVPRNRKRAVARAKAEWAIGRVRHHGVVPGTTPRCRTEPSKNRQVKTTTVRVERAEGRQDVIEARLAHRLGSGDLARGYELLMGLPAVDYGRLCREERMR
jgi:DNA-binding transcriptional regulator YhcF (GntR family)